VIAVAVAITVRGSGDGTGSSEGVVDGVEFGLDEVDVSALHFDVVPLSVNLALLLLDKTSLLFKFCGDALVHPVPPCSSVWKCADSLKIHGVPAPFLCNFEHSMKLTRIMGVCWTRRLRERVLRPEGIEPPAYRFEACRSIHLSYGRTSKHERGKWTSGHRTNAIAPSPNPNDPVHAQKCIRSARRGARKGYAKLSFFPAGR
jgi:hypothetical protein